MDSLVLVTGFGAFPGVERNPSREVAELLEREPPSGVRVRSCELPVTFGGVPTALADFVARWRDETPTALVGLGVHPGTSFRIESLARGKLRGDRPDNDGATVSGLELDLGPDRTTSFDVEALAAALTESGAPEVELSTDAGRYVCEFTYYNILSRAADLGAAGLFLHVPPIEVMSPEAQRPVVAGLIGALALQASS